MPQCARTRCHGGTCWRSRWRSLRPGWRACCRVLRPAVDGDSQPAALKPTAPGEGVLSHAVPRARLGAGRDIRQARGAVARHRLLPVIPLGSVAEGHLELAAGGPRAGHAGAEVASTTPCPWPTAQPRAAPVRIDAGGPAVAGGATAPCTAPAQAATLTHRSRSVGGWTCSAAWAQAIGKSAWVGAAQALVDSTTLNTHRYRTRRMTDSAADRSAARPRATLVAAGRPWCLAAHTT